MFHYPFAPLLISNCAPISFSISQQRLRLVNELYIYYLVFLPASETRHWVIQNNISTSILRQIYNLYFFIFFPSLRYTLLMIVASKRDLSILTSNQIHNHVFMILKGSLLLLNPDFFTISKQYMSFKPSRLI